ncbi:MAG: bifunctional 5-dehydro-2-deoxygluconokinase/5-dehydro-2-deoxyphosphogluconate aldolase [Shimia sp.]
MTDAVKDLDLVTIGRAGVDLYGDQIGTRLEDMGSFSKYIGGSPTNTAIGAARLGMRSALISRVGNDAMGGFIREELAREGVDTTGVITDPERLTALVLLGIRDKVSFPLIFYRENCADAALAPDDVPEALIARARAVVTSGTHFSTPHTKAASLRALELAEEHGAERWIDLDYRPVLWGLAGKGDGETRFVADAGVSAHLQSIMPHLDVVVGTEEEIHIAGGSTDTIEALRALRVITNATFVVKLGAQGCAVIDGAVPKDLSRALVVEGFPIEVFNVLGAGDAFMGGLLTGRLEGRDWAEACRFANACGAFAVSRHACAPSYPSRVELETFLSEGSKHFRLRDDTTLEALHRATVRRGAWPEVLAFAFDHRAQLEVLGEPEKISVFKGLCADVVMELEGDGARLGVLCDHRFGQDALDRMEGSGLWIAAPIEAPGRTRLAFEGGPSLGRTLREWPRTQVVKCLLRYDPDGPESERAAQIAQVQRLDAAARGERLELLLEVLLAEGQAPDALRIARAMEDIYGAGVAPDWWKLEAPSPWDAGWAAWGNVITSHDPHCRGVLLLGKDAPLDDVCDVMARAAAEPLCKGFAIGRTIFGDAAKAWFAGRIDDAEAKVQMTARYRQVIDAWRR